MSRLLALWGVCLLVVAATAAGTEPKHHRHHHHHHHHTGKHAATKQRQQKEVTRAEFASWTGYTAGMTLPDTVAEIANVPQGTCEDGCKGKCFAAFESQGQCFALFVDPGKNFALPADGEIFWNFAARDCASGNNFIDFTGACRSCPDGTTTTDDGTGCKSTIQVQKAAVARPAVDVADTQPAAAAAAPDDGVEAAPEPIGSSPAGRMRQRMQRQARALRQVEAARAMMKAKA